MTAITDSDDLPADIPLFPLGGVLLLPRGQLPLNIFEPRYLQMVEDALRTKERLIGMVQTRAPDQGDGASSNNSNGNAAESSAIYDTGCAGRITGFEETDDGRYLITLTGLCRFQVSRELPATNGYRRAVPDWQDFVADLEPPGCLGLDRERLKTLLGSYFDLHDLSCDWDIIDGAPDERLITCLSMICPLDAGEKQALLEARNCKERARMFMTMLEMALHEEFGPGRSGTGNCH